MAMAVYPSPYNKTNEGGLAYPRDASFSSYLDTAERDFVRSLAESINSPSPVRDKSTTTPRTSMGKSNITRAHRIGELDVFGAERYFNEKLDGKSGTSPHAPRKVGGSGWNHKHRHRREKRDELSLDQRKSPRSNISRTTSLKSPTPSLKSEVSWNSQIGLLLPKKGSVGHKIFSGFQCRGSCFNKKSVYTTNTQQMVKSSPRHQGINVNNGYRKSKLSHHQDHFAFPIIDTASFNLEQPRKSMEVFGVHPIGKQEIERNLEKKLSILAWDAIPNSPSNSSCTISITKKTSSLVRTEDEDEDEDVRSYASSDLFEIGNLSGVAPRSQASTPYYAPSEGSIEWSVVTASAADNFSTFSDHEDAKLDITRGIINKNFVTNEGRKMQRSPNSGGIFLGCTSHKAVDVVGNYTLS